MVKTKKLRRLLPTLREKKHYCIVAVNTPDRKEAMKKIDDAILSYLGILGYAKAAPVFVDFNAGRKRIIIAVSRKYVTDAKAGFIFAGLPCLGVCGTVKKAKEKFY